MSVLTFTTLAAVLYGLISKRGYGVALALGGATSAGSAVIVGSLGVPTFYATCLGTAVWVGLRFLGYGRARVRQDRLLPVPGASFFVLYFYYAFIVTLIAPVLFDGEQLVIPGRFTLIAGVLRGPNVAQIIYAFLGITVLIYLARSPRTRPELLGIAVGLTIALSAWRYVAQQIGIPFPYGVFDNSPSFVFIEKAAGNLPRFRGIYPEPAGLASCALVCIGYMVPRSRQTHGWRRVGCLVMAGIALYLGAISTSATFVVAGIGLAALVLVVFLITFLARASRIRQVAGAAACGVVVGALWILPYVADFVENTINGKVGSSSLADRSTVNSDALVGFLRTGGLGYGLGSARASSYIPSLLASTGLIGFVLLAAGMFTILRRAAPIQQCRPVVWAVVTLLLVKTVAGPDLSDATGVLWIGLGVMAHAILQLNGAAASTFFGQVSGLHQPALTEETPP